MKVGKYALAVSLAGIPLTAFAAGGGFGGGHGHGDGMGRGGHHGHGLLGLIEMAKELDSDRDGAVSQQEFLTRHAERMAAVDVDGDGQVSEQELVDFVTARVEDRIAAHFARLDADGDGLVSGDEAAAPHGERFARMDQDDDGMLTVHDLPDFGGGRHGGHRGDRGGRWLSPWLDWDDASGGADAPADAAPAE